MSSNIPKTENVDRNKVYLEGFIEEEPKFHHTSFNVDLYTMTLRIPRMTEGVFDIIPIEISDKLIDLEKLVKGTPVSLRGNFRSFNEKKDTSGVRLKLSVFVKEIKVIDGTDGKNQVILVGHSCRPTNIRRTPLGREICDIMLAVSRTYNRSDYLPIITWGRNARLTDKLSVGTEIKLEGRIQSREYTKYIDEVPVKRIAYEVSASSVEILEKPSKLEKKDE